MPAPARSYQTLLNEIAALYTQTRVGVMRMYWEIGKRIVEVEQGGGTRAAYGGRLVARLSADLTTRFGAGFSLCNLHRMKALYLQHKIFSPARKLGWSHHVELLSLPTKLQQQLASRAEHDDLSRDELRALSPSEAHRWQPGDLVRASTDGTLTRAADATPAQLYTYNAQIERVVDGDTLWTLVHLTGTQWRREKLRLRGIDCPERGTPAGDAATRYVQTQVRQARRLVVTTTKPDKWDRYLCDVYLVPADGPELFLNNRLLELGHARLYSAVSLADWDPDHS